MRDEQRCELCGRREPKLTKHHLIPLARHKSKRNRRSFDRREVKERVAWLCRACHGQVHAVLSEKDLEFEYNTLGELASHPEIAKFVEFVRKVPPGRPVKVRKLGAGEPRSKKQRLAQRRKARRGR